MSKEAVYYELDHIKYVRELKKSQQTQANGTKSVSSSIFSSNSSIISSEEKQPPISRPSKKLTRNQISTQDPHNSHYSSFSDISECKETTNLEPNEKIHGHKQEIIKVMPSTVNSDDTHLPSRIKNICKLAFPLLLYTLGIILIETLTLLWAGKSLGYKGILAIGFGNMLYNSVGMIIIAGIASAFNAICSIQYILKNWKLVGLLYHRCLIITLTATFFLIIFNITLPDLLLYLGIDSDIILLTRNYMLSLSFCLIPYTIIASTIGFLEAQHISKPQNLANFSGLLIHPLALYVYVELLQMEFIGFGLAMMTTLTIQCGFLLLLTKKGDLRCFFSFERDSFRDLVWMIKQGGQSCLILLIEWWGIEAMMIVVACLGMRELAAHVVLYHIENICFLMIHALSNANFTLLGNFLAERDWPEYFGYLRAIKRLGAVAIALIMCLFYYGARSAITIFFFDAGTQELALDIVPFAAAFFLIDSIITFLENILKSVGRYKVSLILKLISCYWIGLPSAIFLSQNQNLGLRGVWIGMIIGMIALVAAHTYNYYSLDMYVELDVFNKKIFEHLKENDLLRENEADNGNQDDIMGMYMDQKVKDDALMMSSHNPMLNELVITNR